METQVCNPSVASFPQSRLESPRFCRSTQCSIVQWPMRRRFGKWALAKRDKKNESSMQNFSKVPFARKEKIPSCLLATYVWQS